MKGRQAAIPVWTHYNVRCYDSVCCQQHAATRRELSTSGGVVEGGRHMQGMSTHDCSLLTVTGCTTRQVNYTHTQCYVQIVIELSSFFLPLTFRTHVLAHTARTHLDCTQMPGYLSWGLESKSNVSHKASLLLHLSKNHPLGVLENASLLLVRLFVLRRQSTLFVSKGTQEYTNRPRRSTTKYS